MSEEVQEVKAEYCHECKFVETPMEPLVKLSTRKKLGARDLKIHVKCYLRLLLKLHPEPRG